MRDRFVHAVLFLCGFASVLVSIGIVLVLVVEGSAFFRQVSVLDFLSGTQWTPLFARKEFGVLPLVTGTFLVAAIALLVALPSGLLIAVYLSDFASERVRGVLKPMLETLAGIPTVVYGYFALLWVTPFLRKIVPDLEHFNALSPGVVMGIMILPMVSSLSEDALHAVPRLLREGSLALGGSKVQTIFRVVVPAAFGGIVSACIIAMSRAVGETMIVTIAAGQQPRFTLNPLQSVETMTAYIVQVSMGDTPHGTLEYQTLFAVGGLLFLMTLVMNSLSMLFKQRFEERVQAL